MYFEFKLRPQDGSKICSFLLAGLLLYIFLFLGTCHHFQTVGITLSQSPTSYYLVCSILIILSLESNNDTIFWTNPNKLRSCLFL